MKIFRWQGLNIIKQVIFIVLGMLGNPSIVSVLFLFGVL